MPLRTTLTIFLIFVLTVTLAHGAETKPEFAPLFPFTISAGAPENITNISSWNHRPAGKFGFVRVEDGKFVHDGGRFLIWGTNLCFSANFPEKEQAEKLAARLARFGFNCVRLHHMDSRDIWGPDAKSQLTLDPGQMERLDYLIYQLKQHGIYVNINLHVSRKLDERDGFPHKDKRPDYDKGLDNFYPPFIEAQKKYARDLLEHVNPYTKTAYKNEPAVAMVEINNENSVVPQWSWGSKLMDLPEPYGDEFQKQWNDFLKKKYGTTAELEKAWKCVEEPLGEDMLAEGGVLQKWHIETDAETKCEAKDLGRGKMEFKIEKMGSVAWHPQLIANNLSFEAGKMYTFSFCAASDKETTLTLGARMAHEPWENLGFLQQISVTPKQEMYNYSFIPSASDTNARFDIGGFSPGKYEFQFFSLRPGGSIGLGRGQNLENGTIPVIAKSGSGLTKEAIDDFCEFLYDIEERYWLGMYRFLKDELGVKQPVSGTQLHYGSTGIQAKLDYVDNHSYWNHPHFPGRPWDMNNWTVSNRALVNHFETSIFPPLATARVHGKPYTISEFDAPFPNQYAAEALPMLAAFGRFQNWDGIFHFAYSHSRDNFQTQRTTSFFDMVGNTVKLAHLPACVAMFSRGDLTEGDDLILGGFDAETEMALFKKERGCWNFQFKGIGLDPKLALLHPTALDLSGKTSENIPAVKDTDFYSEKKSGGSVSYTGREIMWDPSQKEPRMIQIGTRNTIFFTGFHDESRNDMKCVYSPGIELEFPEKTRLGWKTVSLVSIDGNGFDPTRSGGKPIRILLTATGLMQNTDMQLEERSGNNITFGNRWGKEPVLCEGIPMKVEFLNNAKSVKCYALDESGNRREEVPVDGNKIALKPEYKTLWYEITLH